MPNIHLTTFISAPAERVLDLSRSIGIYKLLFHKRKETFRAATGGSLMLLKETFSIEAKHLRKTRQLTLHMSNFSTGQYYMIEKVKGSLSVYRHDHFVKEVANGTLLIDKIEYGYPEDFIGRVLSKLYLHAGLEKLIEQRNELIRQHAESEKWRVLLD